ncbi:uncharacterized protein LOC141674108 [Apium graveolens]|uniref:uncharacterized protein LOC141674108 n=1 Tax=Apium graveolens TaxID=4045 RepID=UPI003D7C0427
MESAVFNLIEDLDQSTTNWKIKARVTRMWISVSSENGSVEGYTVILLDDDNNHVHAFAYLSIWNGFKTLVIEGGVYVFDQIFCERCCDLFAEANKYQPQQQPEFAIDVIGVIENFEPLTKLDTKFGMLKEEGYLSKREKYLKAAKSEFVQTFMERMTLKDLNEKLTYDDLKKRIYTTFSVVKVDEDVAWWFYSCNKCQQEVERLDRRFRCNNCPRIIPVAPKRFRIMVLAEDDIFSCNVMLMDRAARRIVGTSAAKAYNDFEKAPEKGLPQVLKYLVGNEVTVIIQLNKENVTEDSTIFDANDIFDTTTQSPSPSKSAHILESSFINFSG